MGRIKKIHPQTKSKLPAFGDAILYFMQPEDAVCASADRSGSSVQLHLQRTMAYLLNRASRVAKVVLFSDVHLNLVPRWSATYIRLALSLTWDYLQCPLKNSRWACWTPDSSAFTRALPRERAPAGVKVCPLVVGGFKPFRQIWR